MGPFPHDAPPANISAQNPMGTDGFAFVEFAHPGAGTTAWALSAHGLCRRPSHASDHWGDVDYLVNAEAV